MASSWEWNLFEYLKLDGDGSIDVTGNHAAEDGEYSFTALRTCEIHRMLVLIEDTAGFAATGYGDNASGLTATTGLRLVLRDPGGVEKLDLLGGQEILTNSDWNGVCYDATYTNFGSGNDTLCARFTFANSGSPLVLGTGSSLALIARADMSFLVKHRFFVQGHYRHSGLKEVTF